MVFIVGFAVLVILYNMLWLVPTIISYNRRKQGKDAYWSIFMLAILLETGSIFLVLSLSKNTNLEALSLFTSPLLASIIAGSFYVFTANKLDAKNS